MKTLQKYKPEKFEDNESLLRRAWIIKDFMKEYLRTNPLEGQQKYGIVCHSVIIGAMTAEGMDKDGHYGFKNPTVALNCQHITFNKF